MENDTLIRPQALFPVILIAGFFSFPLMLVLLVATILRDPQQEASRQARYLVYIMIGVGLGYINTTKPTEFSDLGYYYWLYNWASTKSLAEYIDLIPKEPVYFIYNYLMRYLTFGNFNLFMIVTTVLMYFPVMAAFDRIFRENGLPVKFAVIAAVIFACFNEYFFYTAQIVRQVLAGSVAFYFVIRMTYENDKWSYIGLACAGLVHASAFIFGIYYILRLTMNWKFKSKVFIIIASFALFGVVVGLIASLSDTESTLTYAAQRAQSGAGDKVHVGWFPLAVCSSVIPMSLLAMWKMDWEKHIVNILILGIFLVVFVLANTANPLFVLRFMEYCYMYIPLCLVLTLCVINLDRLAYMAMFVTLARFVMVLNKGAFQYESFGSICLDGYPLMLIKIFS